MKLKLADTTKEVHSKIYEKDGYPFNRIVVTYEIDVDFAMKHNQVAHFTITGDLREQYRESFGCLHDEIAEHFPHLEYLIKWHLCDVYGTPLHYLANTLFWYDFTFGRQVKTERDGDIYTPEGAKKAMFSTMIYGSVESDEQSFDKFMKAWENNYISDEARNAFKQWLIERLPELRDAFHRDMITAGMMVELAD